MSDEMVRKGEWQPIATAPKDGKLIMLYDGVHGVPILAHYRDDGDERAGRYGRFVWRMQEEAGSIAERAVTHWMPLPPPPAADGEAG